MRFLFFFAFSWCFFGAFAATVLLPQHGPCEKVDLSIGCKKLSPVLTSLLNQCEIGLKNDHCAEFALKHPEAKSAGTLRDCKQISSCPASTNITTYMGSCLNSGAGAWKDFSVDIWKFFTQNDQAANVESLAIQKFFRECVTADCKRSMLGPFASYFKKEEIEGHPERTDLDPNDVVNQVYIQGYSASTLYKKLLWKLRSDVNKRTMDEKFIEPWSGSEAKLPLSLNELIDLVLKKAGVRGMACLKPEVVAEIRCYAFFSVFDPLVATLATAKILRIAGLAEKLEGASVRTAQGALSKGAAKAEVLPPAKVVVEPKVDLGLPSEVRETAVGQAVERGASRVEITDTPLTQGQFDLFKQPFYDKNSIYIGVANSPGQGSHHYYLVAGNKRFDGVPFGISRVKDLDMAAPMARGVVFKINVPPQTLDKVLAAIEKQQKSWNMNCLQGVCRVMASADIKVPGAGIGGVNLHVKQIVSGIMDGNLGVGGKALGPDQVKLIATSKDQLEAFLKTVDTVEQQQRSYVIAVAKSQMRAYLPKVGLTAFAAADLVAAYVVYEIISEPR